MHQIGKLLAAQDAVVDCMIISPLVRAVQTAEILATECGLDGPISAELTIAHPHTIDDLIDVIDCAPATASAVAIVGHEPTMSTLLAHLYGAARGKWTGFSTGQIVALDHERTTNTWTFAWLIDPAGPSRLDSIG